MSEFLVAIIVLFLFGLFFGEDSIVCALCYAVFGFGYTIFIDIDIECLQVTVSGYLFELFTVVS